MQGSDNNAIAHTDTVKTFITKLELWHGRVQEDTTMQFHRYSEVLVTVNDDTICCRMKRYIGEHLENLIDEFRRYFPDVVFFLPNFVKSFHSKHNLFANSYAMMCNSMILMFFFRD